MPKLDDPFKTKARICKRLVAQVTGRMVVDRPLR